MHLDSTPRFGAVVKGYKSPKPDSVSFDYAEKNMNESKHYFTTDEDTATFLNAVEPYRDALENYAQTKVAFLNNTDYCRIASAGTLVSGSTSPYLGEEDIAGVKEADEQVLKNYPQAPGHAEFANAMPVYHAALDTYRKVLKSLVAKAQ